MTRKKAWILSLFGISLIAVCLVVQYVLSEPYIVKIGNEKISLPEFYVYLYEQKKLFEQRGGMDIWEMDFDGEPAVNVAKQNALNTLSLIKLTASRAKEIGISLTEAEKEAAIRSGAEFYAGMNMDRALIKQLGITEKRLAKIMQESDMYNKVYYEMTKNYVISENDFNSYFNTYYEENKEKLIDIKLSILFIKPGKTGREEAQTLYETLETGTDFDTLATEYPFKAATPPYSTVTDSLDPEVIEAAHNIKRGSYSEVLSTPNGNYIIRVDDVILPDLSVLAEQERQNYTEQKKYEIFRAEYTKWSEKTPITKNIKIWASVDIQDLETN